MTKTHANAMLTPSAPMNPGLAFDIESSVQQTIRAGPQGSFIQDPGRMLVNFDPLLAEE